MGVPSGYTSAQVIQAVPVLTSSAVVQVKSTTLTSTISTTVTVGVFLALTGLTVAITPTSASNKILVMASLNLGLEFERGFVTKFTGGNTSAGLGDAAGNRMLGHSQAKIFDTPGCNITMSFLDAPNTTSATTYGVSATYTADSTATMTLFVNRGSNDANNQNNARVSSTITVMEVTP